MQTVNVIDIHTCLVDDGRITCTNFWIFFKQIIYKPADEDKAIFLMCTDVANIIAKDISSDIKACSIVVPEER
jgi:hypothetical protein